MELFLVLSMSPRWILITSCGKLALLLINRFKYFTSGNQALRQTKRQEDRKQKQSPLARFIFDWRILKSSISGHAASHVCDEPARRNKFRFTGGTQMLFQVNTIILRQWTRLHLALLLQTHKNLPRVLCVLLHDWSVHARKESMRWTFSLDDIGFPNQGNNLPQRCLFFFVQPERRIPRWIPSQLAAELCSLKAKTIFFLQPGFNLFNHLLSGMPHSLNHLPHWDNNKHKTLI